MPPLQQQLAGAGEDQCLLAPEPFLWPVEMLMGPAYVVDTGQPAPAAIPSSGC
jgi:hypothetical protein